MNKKIKTIARGSLNQVTNVINKTGVTLSLRTKIMLGVIISLLAASPISAYINFQLHKYYDGSYGVYINTITSLVVTTGIITLFVQFIILIPLRKIVDATDKVASGDLNVILNHSSNDELGQLTSSFRQMVFQLQNLIGSISSTAESLVYSAEELSKNAYENSSATNKIVISIKDLSSGSEMQATGARECSIAMEEMSRSIQQISENTTSLSDLSISSAHEAKEGNQVIDKVVEQMNSIKNSFDSVREAVIHFNERSKQIGEIASMISEISSQSSLLALNASIEAARAGENGKGFAVVANEVKKLASQSEASSQQVITLIQQIQKETSLIIGAIKEGATEVESGILVVNEAGEMFVKLVQSSEYVSTHIQEVAAACEEMSASSQEVSASMGEMSHISSESLQNAKRVATATEDQLFSIERIAESSISLSELVKELRAMTEKYQVEKSAE
jgi:methyl-accepting chemotaxis protein